MVPKFSSYALKSGEVVKRALVIGETLMGVEIYDTLFSVEHRAEEAAMAVAKVRDRESYCKPIYC